jgi:hypothetical protein
MLRYFGSALVVASSSLALAAGVPIGHVQLQDSYGTTGGGEFRAIAQGDFTVTPARTGTAFQGPVLAAPGLFETFCVEKFEHISLGTTYAAGLNTTTDSTNSNYASGAHGGFNDPIDPKTAYLYTHFIRMDLATSYDYTSATNRVNDANALQTAIWFIEQEDSAALSGKALQLYNEAAGAVAGGAWTGIGDVRVMNLEASGGVEAQDQLVMTVQSIPLPTGAAMAGLGLFGLAAKRRRR